MSSELKPGTLISQAVSGRHVMGVVVKYDPPGDAVAILWMNSHKIVWYHYWEAGELEKMIVEI